VRGPPVRIAVQEGTAFVRVAGAPAAGRPWSVAELPAPGPGVAALLTQLVGPRPEELVLVHPARWRPGRVLREVRAHSALARCVRAVAAPLAAAGHGDVAVLDVGASGAEAAVLDADGRVRAWAAAGVGGRALDELVAARTGRGRDARELREALSLRPGGEPELQAALAGALEPAVAALLQVLDGGRQPVLLVGGLARAPALARLVDEAGIRGAVVAQRPDAAAVLGALALPAGAWPAGTAAGPGATGREPSATGEPIARGSVPGAAGRAERGAGVCGADRAGAAGSVPEPGPDPPGSLLPPLPVPRPRRLRAALLSAVAAAAVVVLLAAGRLVAPPTAEAVPAGVLVQYGYRLDVPDGWEHAGGLPERRRVLLTPLAAPEGSDLIAVERSPLGYDTAAEPERARAELRAAYDGALAAGSALSGYDPGARFAGRAVTAYREREAGRAAVDWFVVLDGDAQLSVGCRHTSAGAVAVRAACAVVVTSLRRG
jgi:type VII secretion-associated protein (TIGR03931 family)